MNGRTMEFLSEAALQLTCAQVNDWSDLTDEENAKVDELVEEITNLMSPTSYIVTLEGWWWTKDERVFTRIDDLHSFPCEQAAVDECDELVHDQQKLLLAATMGDSKFEGTALTVYRRKGSESRAIQSYVLQYGRANEFNYGDDADHTTL